MEGASGTPSSRRFSSGALLHAQPLSRCVLRVEITEREALRAGSSSRDPGGIRVRRRRLAGVMLQAKSFNRVRRRISPWRAWFDGARQLQGWLAIAAGLSPS